jgi:large repetitive protein
MTRRLGAGSLRLDARRSTGSCSVRLLCAVALLLLTLAAVEGSLAPRSGAAQIVAGTPIGSPTVYGPVACAQPYEVPPGVTEIQVDAIGAAGQAGANVNSGNITGTVAGGSGGLGAEVVSDLSVYPGELLYVGVGSEDGMDGGWGGFGGNFIAPDGDFGFPLATNPALGGQGGAASYVSSEAPLTEGGSPVESGCFPTDPLVVAAGGGGGGGAGDWSQCPRCWSTAGDGGTASGSAATEGYSNVPVPNDPITGNAYFVGGLGGPGGAGSAGAQGSGGSITAAEALVSGPGGYGQGYQACTSGWQGEPGGQSQDYGEQAVGDGDFTGGSGGSAALDANGGGPCPPSSSDDGGFSVAGGYANSNSGGGGGGGGGLYAGGGGGGGADDWNSGGGGGAGASFLLNGTADPTPSSQPASVTIQPVAVAPAFTGGTSGTCYVDVPCNLILGATGNPAPSLSQTSGSLPNDLPISSDGFDQNGDPAFSIYGVAQSYDVGVYPIGLDASNDVSPDAHETFTLTVTWGTLSSIAMSSPSSQSLIGGYGPAPLTATGTYADGITRDLTDVATWTSSDPTVATVSSTGVFNAVTAGTATITAAYDGETTSTLLTVTLGQAASIAVTPASPTIGLGDTEHLTATATYMDGQQVNVTNSVTWVATDPSVVSVSSSGFASAIGTGNDGFGGAYASIDYGQGEDISSPVDTIEVSLADPVSVAVTPAAPTVAAGGSEQFTATGTYPNGYTANITSIASWSSSDNSIVGLEEDGLVSVSEEAGVGTYTITATAPDGTVSGSTTLSTTAGSPVSITVTPSSSSNPVVGLGDTLQLRATATYADGSTENVTNDVVWSSDDPSFSVTSGGLAEAVSTNQGDEYAGITAVFTPPNGDEVGGITDLTESFDDPTSISVSPANLTIARSGAQDYAAIGTYPGGATVNITCLVTWSTGSSSVAGIQSCGLLFAQQSAGGQSTSVTATSPARDVSGSTTVSVALGDATSLSITTPSASLGLGQTEQLTATATYENGTAAEVTDAVTWTSNSPSIASISATGLVTALEPGLQASFYASFTYPDGTELEAAPSTVTTNANDPLSISVSPNSMSLLPGQGEDFTATGNYPGGITTDLTNVVSWSSSSTLLDSLGGGTFQSEVTTTGGLATVTAALASNGASGTASVTLDNGISISGPGSQTVTATPSYTSPSFTVSGGSGNYEWQLTGQTGGAFSLSVAPGASSVNIVGDANTDLGTTLDLVLIAQDTTTNQQVFFYFDLTINPQSQMIDMSPIPSTAVGGTSPQNKGTIDTLDATGGASGNPVELSIDGSSGYDVCFLNGDTLTFYNAGSCIIDANQQGNSYYSAAPEVQTTISVQAGQVVSFETPPPSGIVVGSSPVVFYGTSSSPGVVSISIDPATTNNACSIDTNESSESEAQFAYAFVEFDNAGTCVVDANQAGNSSYAAATAAQQTITVGQLSQQLSVTSSPPAGIVVGDTYTPTTTPGASGDPVVVSIDSLTTDDACSAAGGVVSFNHVGECVLDFSEPESATSSYASSPQVQQAAAVGQGAQSISITSPSTSYVGQSETPSATGGGSGSPVTFAIGSGSTAGACNYSAGVLNFTGAGTCVLEANQQGSSDYTAAPRASLDITVVQLQLVFTSGPLGASTSNTPTTAFTVEAESTSGQTYSPTSPLTLDLSSTSAGGTFAASSGGSAVTALTLPAGQSSVTGYYADTDAGSPELTVSSATAEIGLLPASQVETVTADVVNQLSYFTPPVDQVAGSPQSNPISVSAVDAFGNPVAGASVTLFSLQVDGPDELVATGTTNSSGISSFPTLSLAAAGSFLLEAGVDNLSVTVLSSQFNVYSPITVTSVSPSQGTAIGGTTVTIEGSGLSGAQFVSFGGTAATDVKIVSGSEITVVTPAHASGTVGVSVGNDAETSTVGSGAQYTFDPLLGSSTVLTASATTSGPGKDVTLTATVDGDPATADTPRGTVSFYDGSVLVGTRLCKTGVATLTIDSLPSGNDSLSASYGGNGTYLASSSSSLSHLVTAPATAMVTASSDVAVQGQDVTLTAQVSGAPQVLGIPTGSVTFEAGTTKLGTSLLNGSGTATLTTTIPTGMAAVTAAYGGSTDYVEATSPATPVYVYGQTTMTMKAASAARYGSSYAISITVAGVSPTNAGAPQGSVDLAYGNNYGYTTVSLPLSTKGTVSYTTTTMPLGSDFVFAYYAGNDYYFGSSQSATPAVTSPDKLSLSVSPSPSEPGDVETLTVHVTPSSPTTVSPTGTVTFMDGSTTLGTAPMGPGGSTFLEVELPLGAYPLTAIYSGGGGFDAVTSRKVTENVDIPTTLSLQSGGPADENGTAYIYAFVHPVLGGYGTPQAGDVTLYEGTTVLGSEPISTTGLAEFVVSPLQLGKNILTAKYAGDFPFRPSSGSLDQAVLAVPALTVKSSANPAAPGATVTFTATLSHASPLPGSFARGTVTLTAGGTNLGTVAVSSSGKATFQTSFPAVGTYSITASYSGNSVYATAYSTPISQAVLGSSTVTISSSDNPDRTGAIVTLSAHVRGDPTSAGTPTGTVTFMEAGQILNIGAVDGNGDTSVEVASESFVGGTHAVTAVYSGDGNFAGSTSSPLDETVTEPTITYLSSSDGNVVVGDDITFTAAVKGNPGFATLPAGTVTFKDGRATLGTVTLDGNGDASYTTDSLGAGQHEITAVYNGTGAYQKSTSSPYYEGVTAIPPTAPSNVSLSASENPANLGDTVTITAAVSPSTGTGTPTGSVTFVVNGSTFAVMTLDNGSAETQIDTTDFGVGTIGVWAFYSGDDTYLPSTSSTLDLVVQPASTLTPTEVVVMGQPPQASPGESVTIDADVIAAPGSTPSSEAPTGTVTFALGTDELESASLDSNGDASLTTSSLPVGQDNITATYGGDSSYQVSIGGTIEQVGTATTTTLSTSENPATAGDSVTFSVSVAGSPQTDGVPTGSVQFLEQAPKGGFGPSPPPDILGTVQLDSNGDASLATTTLPVGSDDVFAFYTPSDTSSYISSTSNEIDETVNAVSGGVRRASSASAHSAPVAAPATPATWRQVR